MDDAIRGVLDSYKSGIDAYTNRLGASHPKLKPLYDFFRELEFLGERSKDYAEFHTKASEGNFYSKLTNLMADAAVATPLEGGSLPSVSDAAKGYHEAYKSLPKAKQEGRVGDLYHKIFLLETESKTALEFVRKLAQTGLSTEISRLQIIDEFTETLNQFTSLDSGEKKISAPAMKAYLNQTIRALEQAKTVTEIEYVTMVRAELTEIVTLWDTGLMNTLYYSFGNAVAGYQMAETEENRAKVESIVRFLGKYFGVDWNHLHNIPRVREFISNTIWPAVKADFEKQGITNEQQFLEDMKKAYLKALKGKEPIEVISENQTVFFCGNSIPLEDIHKVLETPELYMK